MLKKILDFIFNKQLQLSTLLLLFVSFVIFMQNSHPSVRAVQITVGDLLEPAKEPVVWFRQQIRAQKSNEALSRRLIHLSQEASRFSSLSDENRRLRRMLEFREHSSFTLIPALVLSEGTHKSVNSLMLNRGAEDAVKVNDAVVNVDGIVGKIFYTGEGTSFVQLLTDPNSRISVTIPPSDARGILQWYGGNRFLITDVPNTMPVEIGNLVVTSGFSDIYPVDVPVGIVQDFEKATDGFTYLITGRFLVNFNQINEVFIVRDE